ncbi:AEC family transporter [Sulfurovum sp. XTW-4]|uniref:AEC family transporter n=1 Tax=Sulfurovum xiamenensis TaxID=3019066 RepID=A0ABT7QTY6_9BACT|nr:AEC family transporter [Sulfurovum xiamenensis]MDM5264531.1 AEC family transporter [Sulfurovum xiamenensis]
MIETLMSILFVYVFILLGYMAKRIFKEEMNPKTLTVMSVYFLQPFVTIWGFSTARLHSEHLYVPLIYLAIILLLLFPTILLGKALFTDPKERAIFSIAGFVGNTGNIGIPLGIALFGEASVIYTTLINIANVFVVYIIGVYIYSRGSFSIKESLINIIRIPIIPASIVAILINIYELPLSTEIIEFFKMGAYAGIVLQLFLLGTFLQGICIKELHPKLFIGTISQKFIIVPLATAFILSLTDLALFVQGVIFMEMMVPLAVANINLASLYNCRPKDVTSLILLSTLLFMPLLFGLSYVINHYYL